MGSTTDQKRLQTLQKALPWQHQHSHRTYETDTDHPHQASYLLGRHLFGPLIKRWSTASRLLQIRTTSRTQNTTYGMENQSRKGRKKIIPATITSLSSSTRQRTRANKKRSHVTTSNYGLILLFNSLHRKNSNFFWYSPPPSSSNLINWSNGCYQKSKQLSRTRR